MKPTAIATLLALAFAPLVLADEKEKHDHDHDHDHEPGIVAGPTGGRLFASVEPHAEFFVNQDNMIEIRFFDDDNEPVAPGGQIVRVIMGDRSKPTRLAFAKEGGKLISDKAVPKGELLPTVLQIQAGPGEKTVTERFNLDLAQCPTCDFREYACICDHEHDHDHKHEKKKK